MKDVKTAAEEIYRSSKVKAMMVSARAPRTMATFLLTDQPHDQLSLQFCSSILARCRQGEIQDALYLTMIFPCMPAPWWGSQ